ncbi:BRCA1-associated RING domain protein 1 [Gadus chalcogrammus]|uniref:BRCA1-associated RING domain protein 1 n=1 Tax=Gadus chalcogrammus TaxID=1042646 RepID=UPI0024C4A77F|nr:BRCA1-associated RING domain protein 1 [Gadus chalcogrammus]
MADEVSNFTGDWTQTKEAVANFRQLLLCSKCSRLVTEPVCLGVCEHMLCRSCAGPRAGDGCVVCQSPAWVKDLQINRHLSNITQLFCSLESLLSPTVTTEQAPSPLQANPGYEKILKHQQNFKIWFSPRSRKVRCRVQKPSPDDGPPSKAPSPETTPQNPDTSRVESTDLSIFDFISSQDSGSGSSCPQTRDDARKTRKRPTKSGPHRKRAAATVRLTRKQSKGKLKVQRLETINQQWEIGTEVGVSAHAGRPERNPRRSSKRVSFLGPAGSQTPGKAVPQLENPVLVSGSIEGVPQGRREAAGIPPVLAQVPVQPSYSTLPEPMEPTRQDSVPSPQITPKRPRSEACDPPEGTPKRPRTSPGPRSKRLTGGCGNPALLTTPPSLGRLMFGKSPHRSREGQGESPGSIGRRSPARTPVGSHSLQASPTVMKRNHKGETPLHLAAIKGDVEAAKELLDQGADPNLKDHAGWTPLHEACNLGHLSLVEVLLARGALLNTPGYENDSPLHDATRNGHPAVARLLLQHGASQSVLNLYGKRPADYALSLEMREVFRSSPVTPQPSDRLLVGSPSNLAMINSNGKRDEQMIVLDSKLSKTQQKQLAKLAQLLGMKQVETFSGSVSHVVVPDGPAPTTLSSLQGVLAGCWVLGYSWVRECLRAGEWLPELEYEAGGGPRQGRINKYNLLPPLFDGCFFFLLGSFGAPPKQELLRLLRDAGGQLLSRQPKPDSDVTQTVSEAAYHAAPGSDQALCTQYILYDPHASPHNTAATAVRRRGKVWTTPASWVVDCIAAFRLLPVPEA